MGPHKLHSSERWRENWLAVSPSGGVRVHVGRSRIERLASHRTVATLPAGTPVVLTSSAPRAIRRCRSFASQAGIALEREYLALPSAEAPAYLVEDAPASIAVFVESVLFAPPGVPFRAAVETAVRVVRALRAWRLVRAAARGRVAVGRCT
jgi:hypothetical protein